MELFTKVSITSCLITTIILLKNFERKIKAFELTTLYIKHKKIFCNSKFDKPFDIGFTLMKRKKRFLQTKCVLSLALSFHDSNDGSKFYTLNEK